MALFAGQPLRLAAANDSAEFGGEGRIGIQLVDPGSPSWSGVVTFEARLAPGVWSPIPATRYDDGTVATTATAAGLYRIAGAGAINVRARLSTATQGALNVSAVPWEGTAERDETQSFGAADHLEFTRQPATSPTGAPLVTQPQVRVRDVNGHLVADSTAAITITIASGTGTLQGTATVNAVHGVANFTNLRIDELDTFTLQADSSGLTAAVSDTFAITSAETYHRLTEDSDTRITEDGDTRRTE